MSRYASLPDYIIGVTHEIWEERKMASLHQNYGRDIVMRNTGGLILGNGEVIKDTLASQAAFPDKQLLADDVIWCEGANGGHLSSHRVMITGTHTGHGIFGAPTRRVASAYCIADCFVENEVITDEWLCYDTSDMVQQLGHSPRDWAATMITNEGGPDKATRPFTADQDRPGPYSGSGNDHELGEKLADTLTRIMNFDVAAIGEVYDRACHIRHAGGVSGWTRAFAEAEWMQLRTAFPDAAFKVHHRIGRSDKGEPDRAAIRWSLDGTHTGYGRFGPPTNAPVHIMGFTHAEFGPRGLRREWSLWDEVAIWKQILLHEGAAS
ncbi:ester cyclase [Rhodobacteraceae bacterium N5(2021)]|uniref:Ester cyclase n=1 Tax=Gymnodinialimonas phycosphaerae TaxID=2841589 RepID=A0A975TRL0_9RHOB|nr:ester cyclase [Gymnodinialimonas phycosphaerae]MBY4893533.1 ester cyclase [Gymnodinialimonas phycosphaerae]